MQANSEPAAEAQHFSASPARNRIAAFDIARGIAIVLVVYGHCLRGLEAAGVVSMASWWPISDYVIYTFHMPLFFAISGYLFDRRTRKDKRTVWTGRMRTIVYPYFLWSLVHGSILLALSGSGTTNTEMTLPRLLAIGWEPISPYWFLYALFFCYVLATIFARLGAAALLAIALVGFCLAFHRAPQVVEDVFYAFVYFSLGLLVRETGALARLPSSRLGLALLWLCFALVAALCYRLGIPERLPFVAAVFGCAAVIASCIAMERRSGSAAVTPGLEILGQCSMGIFVMHIIVLGGMRVVLIRILHISDPAILLLVATIAGVLIPTAVQLLAIRLRIQNLVALPSSGRAAAPRGARPLDRPV